MNRSVVPSLFIILCVSACQVGDAGEQPLVNFTAISDNTAAAAPYIHYESDDEIYAVLGDKICYWNGTEWVPLTQDAPETLGPYFHFVSTTEIYAFVGARICKWDGTQWTIVTDPDGDNLGLQTNAGFTFVSETEIYAFITGGAIGYRICMWDGTTWQDITGDLDGLRPGGMHVAGANQIYAVVGNKVCMWDGTTWVDITSAAPGLKADFVFTSNNNIHAVLGQTICQWNGTEWVDITGDAPVAIHPNFHMAGDDFYVIGTDGLVYRSS